MPPSAGHRPRGKVEDLSSRYWISPIYAQWNAGGAGWQFQGSLTYNSVFTGLREDMEVSAPSVCHSGSCAAYQHVYDRAELDTPGDYDSQVGWIDTRDPNYDTQGYQQPFTSFTPGRTAPEQPSLHGSWFLAPGNQFPFRGRQCGAAGVADVCLEMYDGTQWVVLRHVAQMCQTAAGAGNCQAFPWLEEYNSNNANNAAWPDLNGGADGLRNRNIQVQYHGAWSLFTSGSFSGTWHVVPGDPYSQCHYGDWYNYTVFHGAASC